MEFYFQSFFAYSNRSVQNGQAVMLNLILKNQYLYLPAFKKTALKFLDDIKCNVENSLKKSISNRVASRSFKKQKSTKGK